MSLLQRSGSAPLPPVPLGKSRERSAGACVLVLTKVSDRFSGSIRYRRRPSEAPVPPASGGDALTLTVNRVLSIRHKDAGGQL